MNAQGTAPPGLVAAGDARACWWIEPGLMPALRAAGWLAPERIEAALAAAHGAAGRAPVALVTAGDATLVLRGVRHGGVLGAALGRTLASRARPLREIAANAALRAAGAPVPRPAFAGAWRNGLGWRGVVATHFEPDACDGETFLRGAPAPAALARGIERAAQAVRRFHDAGGWHADLHAKNLLLRQRGDDADVLVIDLDRARVLAHVAPQARMAQLMRLYRALLKRRLLDRVGTRGCVAFFHAYVGGDRALRRAMLRRLPAERRRVARHALLYRSG